MQAINFHIKFLIGFLLDSKLFKVKDNENTINRHIKIIDQLIR